MSTIDCSWEQFKQMAKEFRQAAPTLNEAELQNAWKCLGLAYLGMNEPQWLNSAAIVLEMEGRTYVDRLFAILKGTDNE